MAKRMIVMLTVTLVVLGGLGFVKFRQIQVAMAQGASFQPPPEAVTTIVAERAEWAGVLDSIGYRRQHFRAGRVDRIYAPGVAVLLEIALRPCGVFRGIGGGPDDSDCLGRKERLREIHFAAAPLIRGS